MWFSVARLLLFIHESIVHPTALPLGAAGWLGALALQTEAAFRHSEMRPWRFDLVSVIGKYKDGRNSCRNSQDRKTPGEI